MTISPTARHILICIVNCVEKLIRFLGKLAFIAVDESAIMLLASPLRPYWNAC